MNPLADDALLRLRHAAALPDLSETRYQLIRHLASGGMGAVYLAFDPLLEREVAIKVLHIEENAPTLALHIRQEARILARLEHPNIVPIHDAGTLPDGRLFYVMKYVQGRRLDHPSIPSDFPLPALLRLVQRIAEALAFAHSHGVIHRDLKPANIMLGSFGEVLIMDWGVALLTASSDPPTHIVGTPPYTSPEQASGASPIDHRTDLFALGRILQSLLPASPPPPIQSIIQRATHHDPNLRYSSASALAEDILRFLDHLPVSAHKSPRSKHSPASTPPIARSFS